MTPDLLDGDKNKLLKLLLSDHNEALIRPVAALPFRACLTTNFDRSILDAIANIRGKTAIDFRLGDSSFKQAQWEEELFVARIHGAVEAPDSIILTNSQFDALLSNDTYVDFLSTCFAHRNVLFLGFSFYDPAIRRVFNDLDTKFGSATPGRHMALLPADVNSEFIKKAARLNIEVVRYNPDNEHAELWEAIASFKLPPTSTGIASLPFTHTKKYLAACYARAKSQDAGKALRESIAEGIISAVLQEAFPSSITRSDLLERIRRSLGIKGRDTEQMLDASLAALLDSAYCQKLRTDRGPSYLWKGTVDSSDTLIGAIDDLTLSVTQRAKLQENWTLSELTRGRARDLLQHLVMKRGWDLGAAFASGRPPEIVELETLFSQCEDGLPAYDKERLARVMTNMLLHPTENESKVLGLLGRVSFAVEMAFQSPRTTLLHQITLPRKIYFDASVLLPALVEGHPFCKTYQDAISRLKEAAHNAATPLRLIACDVYLNEIISHKRNAEQYFYQLGNNFNQVARSDALYHGATNTNVFVGAYVNWSLDNKDVAFDEFLKRVAPYSSEGQLKKWLISQGFDVLQTTKGSKYAGTYQALERAYSNSLAQGKTPILIEHDALQISELSAEVERGNNVFFVTADRQLRSVVDKIGFTNVSQTMISHVGLVQFIGMMLGGIEENAGLTELIWSFRVSERSHAVRSYFTARALEEYDAGYAMAMPKVIDHYSERTTAEMKRIGADLNSEDPKKRASAFRALGILESNYFTGMNKEIDKIKRDLQ